MNWYDMASGMEVHRILNALAMTIEPFHYVREDLYGDTIRQYKFDGNSFYKAEQLWAEQEGLA